MFPAALIDIFQSQSAQINNDIVDHFGNPNKELAALQTSAIACPLSNLIRIRATGNDRAKFLHSFCTNDIKGLAVGAACEAIFTDVKARTIAHGYVLAAEACHEIWMLPGDQQTLLNHLNRYIITEDVVIEAVQFDFTTFVISGPEVTTVLNAADIANVAQDAADAKKRCVLADERSTLQVTWNDLPTVFISVPSASAETSWNRLINSGATAAGEFVFQHLRIQEGFPICGQDIASDNLAPEAGRITQTISYTKGCYLGQEPIARIDAMGHVNRQLFRCNASDIAAPVGLESLPPATSVSSINTTPRPALAMLKVKTATEGTDIVAKTHHGSCLSLQVIPPST